MSDGKPSLPRGLIGRKGGPTGKAARLPSLRGPRDLTLGGVPKKVFTPNIPSRRDKIKEEEATAGPSKPKSSRESERGRGQRGRGRGRGRGQDNVIQSTSIFEQGPAERDIPKSGGSSWEGGEQRASTSKVSVKRDKSDKESSKRILDSILRDDFIDDGEVDLDPNLTPVILPFSAGTTISGVKKEEVKDEPKVAATKIKVEPGTEMEVDNEPVKKTAPDIAVVKSEAPVFTCKDLFSKCNAEDGNKLVFFQLPDVLPGQPPSRDEPKQPRVKTEPGTEPKADQNTSKDKLAAQMSTCSLSDFSEGFIGKLQIRKSGKAQLVLGNVVLDVSVGTPCGFLQDLVSVKVEEGTGHITALGHVQDRLICTPDFETLLQES